MAYCDTCAFWNEQYNELGQNGDDCIVIGDAGLPPKYCPMYDDHIPPDITYNNAKCEWYMEKEQETKAL